MRRVFTYHIKEHEDITVAELLRGQGFSRHILTRVRKAEGGILVNGQRVWLSTRLRIGDVLTVTLTEEASSEHIVPVELPLDIIYEDEDLLVINKAADMPIHPSIHNYENTLANGLAWYFAERGEKFVYRCINRLDRDTTGLLIVARHGLSGAILSEQVKQRAIHREYLAIAEGEVPQQGVIDAPIARKGDSVIERCVDFARGERAVTHYRRIAYKNGYSLVSLRLETGRTHQIRVHMKYLGHPLIGDYLYHPKLDRIDHQALHSYRLEFIHPITQEAMCFTQAPPWDFDEIADA
ncbi:MAG: RluA family pseudouridine synthase [Eubacteriales bacterium]|nr:RluA family pseudouridine synthase [Eubacteriales bacterium]